VVGAFVPGRAPVVVAAQPTLPLRDRLRTGARFALVELVDHTLPWVLLGVVLAAVAEPLLGHGLLVDLPPALQVPLFAVVGIPLYVCAAGATPIAAVAVHKGVSAGAALAFLLAGPATNVTTFAVLGRLHGRRTAWVFAGAVLAVATAAGWMVDAIGVPAFPAIEDGAHPETHWLGAVAVAAIGVLAVASLFRQGARGVANQIVSPLTAR
jgi:hypothetical protein